jgi:hypothetical protein
MGDLVPDGRRNEEPIQTHELHRAVATRDDLEWPKVP